MRFLFSTKGKNILGVLVMILAIFVVKDLHFDLPAAELRAKYANDDSKFIELEPGLRAHYRDEGPRDAPVLLLIHGTASSLHTFDALTALLAADYRIVRFDLPGFGLTGPGAGCDYSPREDAEFVRRMLDALKIESPVHIAGNSLGGRIAWEFALAFPGRIRGLVLIDSLGYPWPEKPMGIALARVPLLKYAQRYITPYFLIRQSLHEVYGDDALVSEELVDRHFELLLHPGNRAAFIARVNHELDADSARIASLRLPVLVLWGADDAWVPAEHAPHFVRDIPGARSMLYPGVGHVPHEEAPGPVATDLRSFLREVDRAR